MTCKFDVKQSTVCVDNNKLHTLNNKNQPQTFIFSPLIHKFKIFRKKKRISSLLFSFLLLLIYKYYLLLFIFVLVLYLYLNSNLKTCCKNYSINKINIDFTTRTNPNERKKACVLLLKSLKSQHFKW